MLQAIADRPCMTTCGMTIDTNPTGIASVGHIAKGAAELAAVGAVAVVGTGVVIDIAPGAISAAGMRVHIAALTRVGMAAEVARRFGSDYADMWQKTNGGSNRDKAIASLVYASRNLGKAGVQAVANIIRTWTRG